MDPKDLTGWREWKNFFEKQFNVSFLPNVREYRCVVGD
jgi:hypothetical protein